jgi:TMEM175 potassium channel family protein
MSEMTTGRLEAFSDGVIAIIVTIMVLELRAPSQPTLAALWKVSPIFLSYALSFLVVAIMWG